MVAGAGGGGGGGHHHNPLTRVYESNGPEVKIRGTAHHIAEKYLQLARDAQGSGDPVTAENHFQHAEHYLRMIAAAQEQFRAQNPYYQAPPAPGEIRDEAFEGSSEDDGGQPGQGQPTQGQPPQSQPNFGNQQPQNFNNSQNYNNNQQPPYPPREQPQPYGGQQPNANHYQGTPATPAAAAPAVQPAAAAIPAAATAAAVRCGHRCRANCRPSSPARSRSRTHKPLRRTATTIKAATAIRATADGVIAVLVDPVAHVRTSQNVPQEFHGDDGPDAPGNT